MTHLFIINHRVKPLNTNPLMGQTAAKKPEFTAVKTDFTAAQRDSAAVKAHQSYICVLLFEYLSNFSELNVKTY